MKTKSIFMLVVLVGLNAPNMAWGQNICQHGSSLLDSATSCAVFQISTAKVSMSHGDPTGVDGDVCIASGGKLSMSGGQVITGTAFLEPGANFPNDIEERANSVDYAADLSTEAQEAIDSSAALTSLACDVTYSKLKISESTVLDVRDLKPAGGQAVVCVEKDLEVKGSGTVFTLAGEDGDSLIFNVGEALKVNGAKVNVQDGLSASDVVFNLVGPGKDVAFSGGGGGIGCCKAALEGTILAPQRKIALSPGKVMGQVISGKDISLSSGSLVMCPESEDPPECDPDIEECSSSGGDDG